MKNRISIFLLFLCLFSCKQQSGAEKFKAKKSTSQLVNQDKETTDKVESNDTLKKEHESKNQKHYITEDSIVIDEMVFSKETFNKIIDQHPELLNEDIKDPNYTYYELSQKHYSELGGDQYYSIYTYFLRQRYDYTLYQKEQENLDKLYSTLIKLFSRLKGGGTYFGHEMSRIPGFVEYATYSLHKDKEKYKNEKFEQHKKEFLTSLRKRVALAEEDGFGIQDLIDNGDYDKEELTRKYYGLVEEIASLITNSFYLEQAKSYANL